MTKRLFVAINLPRATQLKIEKIINNLKKQNPDPTIKFIDARQAHFTLQFLGNVPADIVPEVGTLLEKITSSYRSSMLVTGQIGAFPSLAKPRVVFLAARQQGEKSLSDIAQALGNALAPLIPTIERRNWKPHLTLARLRYQTPFNAKTSIPPITIPVTHIDLMESLLTPQGPHYTTVDSFSLI